MPGKTADQTSIRAADPSLPAEQRDTEAAIRLWQRRAVEAGGTPPLSMFEFRRLTSDWGYRFLISGDQVVETSVFLSYGLRFARLFGLPEHPKNTISMLVQLPVRYRPIFMEGYEEAFWTVAPVRLSGGVVHDRKVEIYRAAFMPIGANPRRPLIFGSFNFRIVPQEAAAARAGVRLPRPEHPASPKRPER